MFTFLANGWKILDCFARMIFLARKQTPKKVPKQYINNRGNHITKAFREYIAPLIKGEAHIRIGKDGLPVYVRLTKKSIEKNLQNICNLNTAFEE